MAPQSLFQSQAQALPSFTTEHSSLITILTKAIVLLVICQHLPFSHMHSPNMPSLRGTSWIWEHQRLVFNKAVGNAYTQWASQLETHIYKIKQAIRGDKIVCLS
ncbi:hypothetical protein Moror_8514 [Moniliophthora roreri MCA 2997]|uniref:Uncharacterized protein n=1 Tax=Moniliophthora roreri (strain MCA 2997) TaxID=1381753 RepID=V2WKP4_MONRO|nr:hypothetical protein Moror_8514 [Moniliophthora roreri MCA 2997]